MDVQVTFRSEQRLSQDEFFEWLQRRPAGDIHHYELIHGRIVMTPPAGFGHGSTEATLVYRLSEHVVDRRLGRILGSSTGYDLPSGDTLEPDVSFVSAERLAAGPAPDPTRFARLVPDLVVEILSPSTARRDRTEKKEIYAANGVREYWLVDPVGETVTVFHLRGGAYGEPTQVQDGIVPSEVLPDLGLRASEIFLA
jgi:Uma2 family endonuclease